MRFVVVVFVITYGMCVSISLPPPLICAHFANKLQGPTEYVNALILKKHDIITDIINYFIY